MNFDFNRPRENIIIAQLVKFQVGIVEVSHIHL